MVAEAVVVSDRCSGRYPNSTRPLDAKTADRQRLRRDPVWTGPASLSTASAVRRRDGEHLAVAQRAATVSPEEQRQRNRDASDLRVARPNERERRFVYRVSLVADPVGRPRSVARHGAPRLTGASLFIAGSPTAVFVPPPWRVTRGRQRTLTAPRVNASSVERLLQTYASPDPRAASLSGVRPPKAAFAFWMCFSQAGELNLCSMMWVDSSGYED